MTISQFFFFFFGDAYFNSPFLDFQAAPAQALHNHGLGFGAHSYSTQKGSVTPL